MTNSKPQVSRLSQQCYRKFKHFGSYVVLLGKCFEESLLGPLRSEDEGTTILWNVGNFYPMTRYSNTPEDLNLHFMVILMSNYIVLEPKLINHMNYESV